MSPYEVSQLPNDWLALLAVVYALGLKHGMEPDHLATIDGITRGNAARNPRLARWSGFLFSAGHGAIVILVAIGVGLLARRWQAPAWLDMLGAWISIAFLYALGLLNLHSVFATPAGALVAPAGPKSRLLGRLLRVSHPVLIAAVGALFALSFDTVSQVALFSLTATSLSGWGFSIVLGTAFTLGMMTTDGVNGLWVARLLARADRRALVASRAMGLAVAGLSLLVGSYALARLFLPAIAGHAPRHELLLGCAAAGIVGLSFVIGLRLAPVPARVRPTQT
ncbi:MAG: HoxN/HupN/NixA family nickel/cobalt transporter [Burkholderiales bacterium]